MISHQVLRGAELNQILPTLRRNLPFSVNAIDCINRFPERTEAVTFRKEGKEIGISICFHSGYNSHVWFDPVVWTILDDELDYEVLNFLQNKLGNKFVAHVYGNKVENTSFEDRGEWKRYTELIMSVEENKFDRSFGEQYRVLPLSAREVREIFAFLSDGANPTLDQEKREERFLLERNVYAVKLNDRIVSAGAIISSSNGVTSIGAIKTDVKQRRKGLARYLISQLLKDVFQNQNEVILFVRNNNYPAIELYRSLGFREVGKSTFLDHGANVSP